MEDPRAARWDCGCATGMAPTALGFHPGRQLWACPACAPTVQWVSFGMHPRSRPDWLGWSQAFCIQITGPVEAFWVTGLPGKEAEAGYQATPFPDLSWKGRNAQLPCWHTNSRCTLLCSESGTYLLVMFKLQISTGYLWAMYLNPRELRPGLWICSLAPQGRALAVLRGKLLPHC